MFFIALFLVVSTTLAAPVAPANPPDLVPGQGSLRPDTTLIEPEQIVSTSASSAATVTNYELALGQTADASIGLYINLQEVENPQPIRGSTGTTDPGPRQLVYESMNSDVYAPPGTDSGSLPNSKWPMGLSHNRFGIGHSGFARQETVANLPIAVEMAGVDMRLAPGAYRELHWHLANEWAYVMRGSARIAAVNAEGQSFIDDVAAGDSWFFPSGVPHSIQALSDGVEFLLVFDDGSFSEDNTFLATELVQRMPKEVLSKNLNVPVSAFDNLYSGQKYIFLGTPAPADLQAQNITGPGGFVPANESYSFHWSQQQPYQVPGGSIKILDPATFPIAKDFSVALVTVNPGAMREIHWHPASDEWSFILAGSSRLTAFNAPSSSGTVDFAEGDVGYVPISQAHYLENVGTTDLVYLEVLKASTFSDVSMGQWLGLTPPQIVMDTIQVNQSVIDKLSKTKQFIVQGNTNLSDPNGSGSFNASLKRALHD